MTSRLLPHRNLSSLSPSRSVNFCNRLRRNANCYRCSKIRQETACTTVPQTDHSDPTQIVIIITITTTQQITTTIPDPRRSEVPTEHMSVMSRIKISSASCAATKVRGSIMDSSHAKVSFAALKMKSSKCSDRQRVRLREIRFDFVFLLFLVCFEVSLGRFFLLHDFSA